MPIFASKDKSGNLVCNFTYVDGLKDYTNGAAVSITQDDSGHRLIIESRIYKAPKVYLDYSKICGADFVSEKEVKEKGKSVLGRAAVGGLLLGPLGAVVGAVSGTGAKTKQELKLYFVINYKSELPDGEIKALIFEIVGATLHWNKFINALRAKTGAVAKEDTINIL